GRALEIRRQILPQGHPDLAASVHNVAALHTSMGHFDQAEPLCREAMEMRRQTLPPHHPDIAQSLFSLARLCAATDRATDAFDLMQQASAIDDQMISQVFSIASESQRLSYIREFRGRLDAFLSLIVKHMPERQQAIHSGLDLVLRRKAILAEAMALQRDAIWRGKYPHLQPKLEALALLRQEIARASLEGPGAQDLRQHLGFLANCTARKERLEIELAHEIPDMALDAKLRSTDRQAVASALPAASVLIEFARFEVCDFRAIAVKGQIEWLGPRYLAFLLPAGQAKEVAMFDIGDANEVDRMIASLRRQITQTVEPEGSRAPRGSPKWSGPRGSFDDPSKALRTLFASLLRSLGGCKRLFIAPDGDLTRLPFEILLTEDGKRLIEKYEISYVGCGRDILRFGRTVSTPCAKPLVAADPNFDLALSDEGSSPAGESTLLAGKLRESDIEFGRLSGSRIEGTEIAALLGVQPWLDDSVLESSLKSLHSPRILHIATHGFFLPNPGPENQGERGQSRARVGIPDIVDRLSDRTRPVWENPLLWSGLALAGAETWRKGGLLPEVAEDGILTAEDVSGLDLLGTELVVLSACDTGLGEVQAGEGVYGLRRAFLLAGAETLVMTLWRVDDKLTRVLMLDFYHRLKNGEGPATALQQAKLMLKKRYPEPWFWAAFICQGDPGPLRRQAAEWPHLEPATDAGKR
ncbi:MAG: CHAT domain-containing protein, partial [Acidobacteria bacterium]